MKKYRKIQKNTKKYRKIQKMSEKYVCEKFDFSNNFPNRSYDF